MGSIIDIRLYESGVVAFNQDQERISLSNDELDVKTLKLINEAKNEYKTNGISEKYTILVSQIKINLNKWNNE
jgi:hypothetical protein